MLEIANKFSLEGNLVSVKNYANGLVNKTFLVETTKRKYILQRINSYVFKNPLKVMNNIELITTQLCKRRIPSLQIIYTKDEKNVYYDKSDSSYYRMYNFLDTMENMTERSNYVNLEVGKAIGEFQSILSKCDTSNLVETIKDFHNTPLRLKHLERSFISLDNSSKRKQKSSPLYYYIIKEKEKISQIQQKIDKGKIPLRIAHNDTKLSNIMFDKMTKKACALVDLDTVMPGTVLFDYGDAVRTSASTVAETSTDLGLIDIDEKKFCSLTIGYLSKMYNVLSDEELDSLYNAVETIILECSMRFLTDYLENDNYFKIDYPEQNYDRALNQLTLYGKCLMKEEKLKKMTKVILNRFLENAK